MAAGAEHNKGKVRHGGSMVFKLLFLSARNSPALETIMAAVTGKTRCKRPCMGGGGAFMVQLRGAGSRLALFSEGIKNKGGGRCVP